MKHLRGGRRVALIVGLLAAMALSITPNAMAAAGAGSGAQQFCLSNGDCGELVLKVDYANVLDRGGAVAFACTVVLPSTNVNFIGVTVTECRAENWYTGTQHYGLQNGNAGPTTATAGGTTTNEEFGWYDVCVEGQAFYVSGSYGFSGCSNDLVRF